MPGFHISQKDGQRCNDLITIVGLPRDLSPEYEKHFASNRKIVAVYRNIIFEVTDIEYFDAPEGEIRQGDLVIPKRRMNWGQRFLGLAEGQSIDAQVIDYLYLFSSPVKLVQHLRNSRIYP